MKFFNNRRWSERGLWGEGGNPLSGLGVALCALVVAIPVAYFAAKHKNAPIIDRLEMINATRVVADYNGDGGGVVSDSEWGVVYKSLGLAYDPKISDPERDLSRNQLVDYLKAHGDSLPESSSVRGYIDGLEK